MSMSLRTRTWIVLASTATLSLSTATVAAAADDPPPPEPTAEEAPFEWPPADTDGEWLPVPDELWAEPLTLPACGSTVTITVGDVQEDEYRAMQQSDGTVRVEYRGDLTVDIVRESDGATLDELANGGPGSEIYSADGLTVVFSWDGPAAIFAFDEVEEAVFAAQGLPPIFYYESGNTTERVVFSEDPAATTIESAEFLTDTARGVRDICDMLDEAADDDS
jgi:hypothetical protein